jgi:hypothetical protein
MQTEMIIIITCAFALVFFWRTVLILILGTVVGLILLGLITALGLLAH